MHKLLACILLACMLPISPYIKDTTVITDRAGLEAISENPSGNYLLIKDIDMEGEDWTPIAFSGKFNGNGHTISNLHITSVGADTRDTVDGNYKVYDTGFAGLFSAVENASIQRLNIKNVIIETESTESCFMAGLAGYAINSEILDCSVSGRFQLTNTDGINIGAGGLVGFMDSCTMEDCTADVELIIADMNTDVICEEFAGGLFAIGRGQVRNCSVKARIWASIHGYVHNGGFVGMTFRLHKEDEYKQFIYTSTSDTEITFFEDSPLKHGYSDVFVGENLGSLCRLSGDKKAHFVSTKVRSFDTILLPETPYENR